jgi:hypothetical protein
MTFDDFSFVCHAGPLRLVASWNIRICAMWASIFVYKLYEFIADVWQQYTLHFPGTDFALTMFYQVN